LALLVALCGRYDAMLESILSRLASQRRSSILLYQGQDFRLTLRCEECRDVLRDAIREEKIIGFQWTP
jgi:hypothetical protein